ncbi:hypothetical protein JCM30471_31410 [Desulfuromonas carbonis]|uniref:sensor histidine kinase n=1 Tax=Desulfuromonas sp. DDH964 TaxID=1823759 RepID=UPI00078BEE4D|nr:ATP-binding protein [Desulfuromonas sp. DDH964]AMV71305.1 sensor histidine kinase, PAS and GAF domain-containing [Desulfuromonas sp. DDH964]
MNRSHRWQRTALFLVLAGMLLLALIELLTALQAGTASKSDRLRLGRQAALAAQAARRLEWPLQRLQEGLAHLAESAGQGSPPPASDSAGMELLYHEFPEPLLTALYRLDSHGRAIGAYPAGVLTDLGGLPQLQQLSTHPSRLQLLSEADPPLLALRQPFYSGTTISGEYGALVDLRRLAAATLAELTGQADLAFIVDAGGRFLLHTNPGLDGRPAIYLAAEEEETSLRKWLRQGCAEPVADLPTPLAAALLLQSPAAAAGGTTLRLTPLRIGESHWSLGLVFPVPEPSAPLPHAPWAGPLLLLASATLAGFAWRQQRLQQELATRTATCRGQGSDLQQLSADLELANQRYQHLLDHAGDALFFLDPGDGSLLEINRQAEELLGYSAAEIHCLSLEVLFPGQQRRRFLRLVHTVRQKGYGESDDLIFRRKDGSLFTGAVHARLGQLGQQKVVHGVLRDVTERKRINQELRQRNRDLTLVNEISLLAANSSDLPGMLAAILQRLVENFAASGGGIFLARESGTRLRLEAHHGLPPEIVAMFAEIASDIGVVGRVMKSGQPKGSADLQRDRRVHFEPVREAGWRAFQAVPLIANDQTVGVFFLFARHKQLYRRDEINLLLAIGRQLGTAVQGANLFEALAWQNRLTQASNRELRISRQRLRDNLSRMTESKRSLEHLERMKSQFLALASHELRTPLTYILSGSELLADRFGSSLDDDGRIALSAVQQGGLRLNEVVGDLLEVARIESQDLYLSREPVAAFDLVSRLHEEFKPRMDERSLRLEIIMFPDAVRLNGDAHHLRRTFGRLLENAVKFTPAGGVITISGHLRRSAEILARQEQLKPFSPRFFRTPPPDQLLQITIRDSGVGIDPEEQLRIFDKFYEVGEIASHFTSTSRFGGKGVGLGLALVKGVIEAHGGMVWVESSGTADGDGSAFHLLLPAIAPEAGSAAVAPALAEGG